MDPLATVNAMLDALSSDDLSEARALGADLLTWRMQGGFIPAERLVPVVPEEKSCDHAWRLVEHGYVRTWGTEIREDVMGEVTIIATYNGTEDFSDDGDGRMRLECSHCLVEKPLPEGWEIDYR